MRLKTRTVVTTCLVIWMTLPASVAFGWGNHTHPAIGYAATASAGLYPNANNGPDLCLLMQDAGFAHGDVAFANIMVEIATQISTPALRERLLALAYGWGSHMMADRSAHQDMLAGFTDVEHGMAELGIDWWLLHNGSSDEQRYTGRAGVAWSSWLVNRASEVYLQRYQKGRVLRFAEIDRAGERFANLIAAEMVVMLLPNFYDQATAFSDKTSGLLSDPAAWRVYYAEAVLGIQQWLAAPANITMVTRVESSRANRELLMAVGERAIALGGLKRLVSVDTKTQQVSLQMKDPMLCKRALKEVLAERHGSTSREERGLAGTLAGTIGIRETSGALPTWGRIKDGAR